MLITWRAFLKGKAKGPTQPTNLTALEATPERNGGPMIDHGSVLVYGTNSFSPSIGQSFVSAGDLASVKGGGQLIQCTDFR